MNGKGNKQTKSKEQPSLTFGFRTHQGQKEPCTVMTFIESIVEMLYIQWTRIVHGYGDQCPITDISDGKILIKRKKKANFYTKKNNNEWKKW